MPPPVLTTHGLQRLERGAALARLLQQLPVELRAREASTHEARGLSHKVQRWQQRARRPLEGSHSAACCTPRTVADSCSACGTSSAVTRPSIRAPWPRTLKTLRSSLADKVPASPASASCKGWCWPARGQAARERAVTRHGAAGAAGVAGVARRTAQTPPAASRREPTLAWSALVAAPENCVAAAWHSSSTGSSRRYMRHSWSSSGGACAIACTRCEERPRARRSPASHAHAGAVTERSPSAPGPSAPAIACAAHPASCALQPPGEPCCGPRHPERGAAAPATTAPAPSNPGPR